MRSFFKENIQLIVLIFIWLTVGINGGASVAMFVIPLIVILLWRKGFYVDVFLGYLFILIMSDTRVYYMHFAEDVKNIYIVLLAIFMFMHRDPLPAENRLRSLLPLFIPFFVIAAICLLDSETVSVGVQKTISYILLIAILPFYIERGMEERGVKFFRDIIGFSVFILCGSYLLYKYDPSVTILALRYRGIFGNPNGVGIYVFLFYMMFNMFKEFFPNMFSRWDTIFINVVVFYTLYLCGSRTSIVAISIFYLFRYLNNISTSVGFILLFVIGFAYQLIMVNLENIIIVLHLESYFRFDTIKEGSGRVIAWTFAWNNILGDTFFFGKGFGYTDYLYNKYQTQLNLLGHAGVAHNTYLTFWLDTGLMGLIAYLFGFISSFVSAAKKSKTIIAVLYAVLFAIFFESWLAASLNPFSILLFILVCVTLNKDTILAYCENDSKSETIEPVLS